MRKFFKRFLFAFLGMLLLGTIAFWIVNEPVPEIKNRQEADELAFKMLEAIRFDLWEKTAYVEWNFRGIQQFYWNRVNNQVLVEWGDYRVLVDVEHQKGIARKGAQDIDGEAGAKLVEQAINHFYNASFWLNAPAKIGAPGTERGLVEVAGQTGLLVTYTTGGETPGDSYLWLLDENGLPQSCKMWVSRIPIGGFEFTWEKWAPAASGALLSHHHQSWVADVYIQNVKALPELPDQLPFGDFPVSEL